ncbi:ABC transporter permease [Listeria sp. SHR_NRA_18]|uniref:ABC transporter permease n=1 Tax=Listeria sp. SHR_NRA_18 TaxID=2269046 RepID=UPI00051E1142|nr:ABC transporter permease [Listeria sp. SHR_NRA_18]KGL38638.1 hypothetical protein EP56_15850 [Listeriaceae bacterium FSL A5-0209]RQW67870.1 ABC transporter permease [Listeria sp. SHR_NRA_18]
MKNLGHAITEQFSYQRKSRRLLWLLLGILVVCCLSSFNQYEAWKSPNEDLKAALASNKSIGYTLEQALAADQVITKVDGVESSDNPIKYFYYEAKTQKAALNPWNAPNQFFTSLAVVVLPVMWGLYCILTTLGTNKAGHEIRSYRSSFFGKLIALCIVGIGVVTFATILSIIVQFVANAMLGIHVHAPAPDLAQLPIQTAYQCLVFTLFASFFFFLATWTKSQKISILTLAIYMLLIPNLGGFDLKNLLLLSLDNIYNTSASTMDIMKGQPTDMWLGYTIIVCLWIGFGFFTYHYTKLKQDPKATVPR